jgi:hypothetical protein
MTTRKLLKKPTGRPPVSSVVLARDRHPGRDAARRQRHRDRPTCSEEGSAISVQETLRASTLHSAMSIPE